MREELVDQVVLWDPGWVADAQIPPLDDQLCFDLYAASRAVTSTYRPVLTELGLTYPQYLVLVVLWEEGPVTVGRLATRLHLDYGTLTPLLRRMETGGLVTRGRASSDERFVHVELTAHGDGLRVHATRVHCDMTAALGLTPTEFDDLQDTLKAVTARLLRRGTP